MKKRILTIAILNLFLMTTIGCSTIDTIKEMIFPTGPSVEELYKVDDDFNAQTPVGTDIYEGNNYILKLKSSDYAIKPERSANVSCSFDWVKDTSKTMTRVGYFLYENRVEYDIQNYNDLADVTIGEKTYKVYGQENNGMSLLYKNDENSYLRIELYPLQTMNTADNSVMDLQAIDETLFTDTTFINVMDFTMEVKEGAVLPPSDEVEILVQPEVESEVNYTDAEVKVIHTLIYSEEMAIDAVERLNKVGVYGITSATLETSNSGYLVNVKAKDGNHYLVYINMNKHTYAIQKDNQDGEYLYLESTD